MGKRGNGEGTIYYSETLNKWVGQFTAGRKENGKLNRKSVYGNTRKEVRDKINKALSEIKTKTYIEKSNVMLIDILTEYIKNQLASNTISEASYRRKELNIEIIKKLPISKIKMQDITNKDINDSLQTLTFYSDSVLKKICGLLSTGYDIAVLNKIVLQNPFRIKGAIIRPKSLKETKKIEALTLEEQKEFILKLENYYEPYKTIFYIAIYSGLRIGEVLALTKNDIDFTNNKIYINKTLTKDKNDSIIMGKTTKTYSGKREIPILKALKPILSDYLLINNTDYLFEYNKHFISPNTINSHYKRICTTANIRLKSKTRSWRHQKHEIIESEVNTHMLRHTFATRCIESGMSAIVLSKILGHKDIETTLNTYTDVFDKFKQDEFEKIDNYFVGLH